MEEMNTPVVILTRNLKKSFRVYYDKSHTLKERIIHRKQTKYSVHQVLDGIDLEIHKGETVALIGQNGSGKSTLLKLLTGIIYPDAGTISIQGKISSLLELGAGFHPDFSGRENIYNNASIFGLSKKEIDRRYEKIVAFSELEEYIDNPVRTYSSGMYMRLAFSVAINVNADVLLVDEILAVGDANFQKKCLDMIRTLKRKGTTIVIVTHDMGAVERICDRAVWLVDGKIRQQGRPREIIDDYLIDMDERADEIARREQEREAAARLAGQEGISGESDGQNAGPGEVSSQQNSAEPEESGIIEYDENGQKNRWGNGDLVITKVELLDGNGQPVTMITAGQPLTISLHYEVMRPIESLVFGIGVKNANGDVCLATNSDIRHASIETPPVGERAMMNIGIPACDLAKGTYFLDVAAHSLEGLPYDYHLERYSFLISNPFMDVGIYAPDIFFERIKV
jgi:ABC-2 type transport system ATP-binding protein